MSLSGIESRLAEIRDNISSVDSTGANAVSQLAAVVAALGVGGVFGSLASGGTIAEGISKLNPILSAISAIGGVADAIAETQQASRLAEISANTSQIASSLGDINYNAARIKDGVWAPPSQEGEDPDTVRYRLNQIAYTLATKIADIAGLDSIRAAIAASGGGGGVCDMSGVESILAQIRDAIVSSGGGVDLQGLEGVLDKYWLVDSDGNKYSLAKLILMLLNHNTIHVG